MRSRLGNALQFRYKIPVVENVVVAQGGAFGKPVVPAGVLYIHRIVELQFVLSVSRAAAKPLDSGPSRRPR